MNKNAIKKFAIEARKKLIASVSDRAGMLGITSDGCSNPISKGIDFEVYKTVAGTEVTLNRSQCEQRKILVEKVEKAGFYNVVEEVAYTWFNRICAVRFMEVNDFLPTRIRVLSSEKEGKREPDIVTMAPDVNINFTSSELDFIYECKSRNELDKLFNMLFIKQCNLLSELLPELFESMEDYTEMLLNLSYTNSEDVISLLLDTIDESDFDVNKNGQVEIIGWLYQYYNEEKKNEVINIYKGTVNKEDIPAATQLFTTDWVVRYMVDNSLGKYWIERNPNSNLVEKCEFLITKELKYVDEKISPEELRFIDPCMGSGHILVYAFDVLMHIYKECGYTERDAAKLIVENNIFGLDIDNRAYQLAYFAILMKGRSYDRRFLSRDIKHNLCAIQESNGVELPKIITAYRDEIDDLFKMFVNAKETGSLVCVKDYDYEVISEYIINNNAEEQLDFSLYKWFKEDKKLVLAMLKQAQVLKGKYHAVVTNPPYLGKMVGFLKQYVLDYYKDYSGDLFSAFMYRNFGLCMRNGYCAFMTPFVWMFIKTYEKLRNYIVCEKSISSLIQMEYSAFEEATVPICSFVLKNAKDEERGIFFRLSDYKGGMEVQKKKVLEALNDESCSYMYCSSGEKFKNIPGMPIAYWMTSKAIEAFNGDLLGDYAYPKQGFATGDNNKFLRMWYEVDFDKVGIAQYPKEVATASKFKWFPCNKGGAFRKWYGNINYVVNWEHDGMEMKNFKGAVIRNPQFYFEEGMTWSTVTSGKLSMRYSPKGFLFESKGSVCFMKDKKNLLYLLGFMNSCVVESLLLALSPTLDYHEGPLSRVPVMFGEAIKEKIEFLVKENIELCKSDWDERETSWEFSKSPIVNGTLVKESVYEWIETCQNRFKKLKENEEKLNDMFIQLYGLEEELTPKVEDKDITIRIPSDKEAVKMLLSYAVGCMFGRYDLNKEGLQYVNKNQFSMHGFVPERDNIIPITTDEYFEDDIVGKLTKWLSVAYGAETVEENLEYIASVLSEKQDTARNIIRNYFVTDFFNDHCEQYAITGSGKRPIYWLFESGKNNGLKALMYIHRYTPDVVGVFRTEYLHKTQNAMESSLRSQEYILENASNATDKSNARKKIDVLHKQIMELQIYDQAVAHIATKRIELDLDEGIKVNYAKFQNVEVSTEGKKANKINLLAKI